MPTTYIYVFKWFKVSKKTRKTSEVCKKPVLQNKTGGCYIPFPQMKFNFKRNYAEITDASCGTFSNVIITESYYNS